MFIKLKKHVFWLFHFIRGLNSTIKNCINPLHLGANQKKGKHIKYQKYLLFLLDHLFPYFTSSIKDAECWFIANKTLLVLCMMLST